MLARLMVQLVPAAVALATVVVFGSVLILALGGNPAAVGLGVLESTLLSTFGLADVFFKATPLIFTGLAVAIPFHGGMFNIGAEGQLLMGAAACAAVAQNLPGTGVLGTCAAVLAAAAAGGAAAGVAGWLRHARGVSEVLSTIMLNFIYTAFTGWLLHGWLGGAQSSHSPEIEAGLLFSRASLVMDGLGGSLLSTSFILALVVAGLLHVALSRTVAGYALRTTGHAPLAALHAGMSPGRILWGGMAAGGAMAGLGGAHLVLGARYFFEDGLAGGQGFLGIAVALLSAGQPLGIIPAAMLFAVLSQAGLSLGGAVPRELVLVLQGAVVLALGGSAGLLARLSKGGRRA